MAQWTEPKTIVPGSAALSADWNTYIRDNSQYLKDDIERVEQFAIEEIERVEQAAFAISIALS